MDRLKLFGVYPLLAVALLLTGYLYAVPKVWLGNFFFGESDFFYNTQIAQTVYSHAIKFESRPLPPPYAYYQLSRTYFIEGQFDTALELAEKELEYYPEHVHTNYILGLTLGYMHREQEAIEAFGKFLEYKPESWAARNDKAWLHFRIGDITGAMETIIPAAQEHPTNPWVMNTFGVLLMNQGLVEEAERALMQAKMNAEAMDEEGWGMAYPGNSPEIYGEGLVAMRASIAANLERAKTLATDDN